MDEKNFRGAIATGSISSRFFSNEWDFYQSTEILSDIFKDSEFSRRKLGIFNGGGFWVNLKIRRFE
ncbi:hypothetical protein [Oscillatoria sp. HE19RPO]|uniref:hypothetical protein n=1 Tax=Oscillatoria sp. HE19RPO TaxID=2954806 RepID=UPI0020C56086|nr:hypothetical protein [Oscillatoria sp. HE19RPO]